LGVNLELVHSPEHLKTRSDVLVLLNKYFKTAVVEKYPEAMMATFIDNAWKNVLGDDYRKDKVSKADRERIRDNILEQLRSYYGKWISVVNFDKKFRFRTNFEFVYKTEHGRLYGNPPGTYFANLFFTSHSLEQFEQRVGQEKYRDFASVYRKANGTNPTAADVLAFFVLFAFQFAIHKNFIYLNVNYGILVIEVLEQNVCIVKTFLSPEMNVPIMQWRIAHPESRVFLDGIDTDHFLNHASEFSEPIEAPVFEMEGFDYDFFHNILFKGKLA